MEQDRTEFHHFAEKEIGQLDRMATAYRGWAQRVGAKSLPMPQTPPGERGGALPRSDFLKTDR